ncbi:MAG: glycosyl hydrolase family 43 [Candidatus Helarchaeota archaeon]|nr:glycosyl hydrolase family 43 [Candidatus Helarchaeota archaeon]
MAIERYRRWKNWEDCESNPLISPKLPEWIIADPTFIPSNESPDGKWHLFAHGILFGINHFVSSDGINWINTHQKVDSGMRPFLFKDKDDTFYLFYEKMVLLNSMIVVRKSNDLFHWSEFKAVLKPSLPWEGGIFKNAGNPCLVKAGDKFRLYYSCNSVFLPDCLFNEPKYIGFAESANIEGPYEKHTTPIITPSKENPYRNFGAGAMKVLKLQEDWIGFNNGIYKDKYGRSRSAILLLYSTDGIEWQDIFNTPIIYPIFDRVWKRTFVYQLDVRKVKDSYWLYYNARHGWFLGTECIGLARLKL